MFMLLMFAAAFAGSDVAVAAELPSTSSSPDRRSADRPRKFTSADLAILPSVALLKTPEHGPQVRASYTYSYCPVYQPTKCQWLLCSQVVEWLLSQKLQTTYISGAIY
jgi:hypothetical protein